MGRPPTCICGECQKCRHRVRAREKYQVLSPEERRALIARRDRDKVRAADRARHVRDREKRLVAMRAYRQANWWWLKVYQREWARANPERVLLSQRAWRHRNPEKRRAHNIVNAAVRSGRLERGPCEVCGSWNAHGHHDDYSKPLEVRWLCSIHHAEEHGKAA